MEGEEWAKGTRGNNYGKKRNFNFKGKGKKACNEKKESNSIQHCWMFLKTINPERELLSP